VDKTDFYIDYIEASAPLHPNVIPMLKILSSDIFACVVKQQHCVDIKTSLQGSREGCVASLHRSRVFTVDFLQR
jgi:hypothetical protein